MPCPVALDLRATAPLLSAIDGRVVTISLIDEGGTVDRSIPICDAHHHLWAMPTSTYLVEDFHADLASTEHHVTSTVYMECGAWYRESGPEHMRPIGETEWVAQHVDARTQGIVGHADLRLGDAVAEVLDAHAAAGGGLFRGIRHMATWDASPEIKPMPMSGPHLLADPQFRRGFTALTRAGLSFDAWLYFPQLPDLCELADVFSESSIILNHLGGPIIMGPYTDRRQVLATWRPLVEQVAERPNVVMKLGGIGMPIYGLGWHKQPSPPTAEEVAAAWREPVRFCIEAFGVDRCMFESNFPVDKFSMSYATLWDAFALMVDDLSRDERNALFSGTATNVYRLEQTVRTTP
jgi:predicted TIM-barrel fold metal-dependent hydrolase